MTRIHRCGSHRKIRWEKCQTDSIGLCCFAGGSVDDRGDYAMEPYLHEQVIINLKNLQFFFIFCAYCQRKCPQTVSSRQRIPGTLRPVNGIRNQSPDHRSHVFGFDVVVRCDLADHLFHIDRRLDVFVL